MAARVLPFVWHMHLLRSAQHEVQCYQCLKPVDKLRLEFNPARFGFTLGFSCHGAHEGREVRVCRARTQEDEVDAVRECLQRCAIVFLPEQGADMERRFNRL